MPKQNIDYSRTVMYKIVCNDLTITELYVGSTSDFTRRKSNHKSHCKTKDLKIYTTIKANGGWDNWSMVEIEKYSCADGNEARSRERYWIEELAAKLNTKRPIVTVEETAENKKEYENTHKENKNKYNKEYRETHKEECQEYHKEYDETHKEEIKERRKEYIETNRELINQKSREYYYKNKERIIAQRKAKTQFII
jgi:lysophospholipase L1-like esterase